MKTMLRASVTEFFKRRAGTFLVLLGVLFGFLRASEHYAFAVFFLSGSYGMLLLFAIWLAYTFVCAQFLNNLWKQPEYTFIYNARLWPGSLKFQRFTLLALGFLQPILFYGLYLSSIAFQEKLSGKIWLILLFFLILTGGLAVIANWRLNNPERHSKQSVKSIFQNLPRPASWLFWAAEWLFRERGITLLAGKIGAFVATTGTMLYYATDHYDLRLPAIGLSFAYLLNAGISLEYYQWENAVCLWGKSMPVTSLVRFGRILAFHAMLIFPETVIIFRDTSLAFHEILQLYLLGITLLTVIHLLLYKKQGLPEDPFKFLLFGFIGLTLLILYKIPLLLLAAAGMLFSARAYMKWYKI